MIMRTESNLCLPVSLEAGDLISKVAVLQHEAARQTEQRERQAREDEQRTRVEYLKDSAALARQGAIWGLVSGLLRGAATLASAGLQLKGAAADAAAGKDTAVGRHWGALARVVDAHAQVDWAGYLQRRTEGDKQQSDLGAELAGDRAQKRADAADEAKRQAEGAASQLEKACETRHRTAMAAQRI